MKKNLKNSLITAALVLSFSVRSRSQDIVMIKVIETTARSGNIIVTYGNGKVENIPTEKAYKEEHYIKNTELLRDKLEELYKKGYKIQTYSMLTDVNVYLKDIVLYKEKH